jgi:ribulose-bisphosphate carboxylase large chain
MSSDSINLASSEDFVWRDGLDPTAYDLVEFYLESSHDPRSVSIAIAREQSAVVTMMPHNGKKLDYEAVVARVVTVEVLGEATHGGLMEYTIASNVYDELRSVQSVGCAFSCVIAFPRANYGDSITNMWSHIAGEVYRLGLVSYVKLMDVISPGLGELSGIGPLFGAQGIRDALGRPAGPLLCRSVRPAVGLTTDEMRAIHREALLGGCHVIKDDELTSDCKRSPSADRFRVMAQLTREAEQSSGERKLYVANAIASVGQTVALAKTAVESGADVLLLSSALQGLEICNYISREFGIMVFNHNTWLDVLSRHPFYGVSDMVLSRMSRTCGSDFVMMPGYYATPAMKESEARSIANAVKTEWGHVKPAMCVLAGGKRPEHLSTYRALIGSDDYMLTVASAIDNHVGGIREGARHFREQIDRQDYM